MQSSKPRLRQVAHYKSNGRSWEKPMPGSCATAWEGQENLAYGLWDGGGASTCTPASWSMGTVMQNVSSFSLQPWQAHRIRWQGMSAPLTDPQSAVVRTGPRMEDGYLSARLYFVLNKSELTAVMGGFCSDPNRPRRHAVLADRQT